MQKISHSKTNALILAGLVTFAQVAMSLAFQHQPVELVANLLYLVVLIFAMGYGRRAGSLASLAATLVYALFLGLNVSSAGLSFHVPGGLIPIPVFGIIGIVGGEYAHRLRYSLASMHGDQLDQFSGLYNQRCMHDELVIAMARYARYGELCSLMLLSLPPEATRALSAAENQKVVRAVADRVRSTLRTVDRLGRLGNGQYVALMPHTPVKGAEVARKRVLAEVRVVLCKNLEASAQLLALPEDAAAMHAFIASISPTDSNEFGQASIAYSSSADMIRKSVEASAASASSLSTLNTSTAPVPEGLTKQ